MAINWGNAGQGAIAGGSAGSSFGPWGTAIGAGVGGLAGLFGGNDDPTEKSRKILEQIPEKLRPYFQKYFETGQNQLPQLSDLYGGLLKDPGGTLNRIGAGYKQSPGFKWTLDQGEQAINNASAAGGMAGTNAHGQNAGQLAENLANQDYQDYLSKALGLFGTGASGSMDLAKMGQTAGSEYGLSLGANQQSLANLDYEQGAQGNQNNNQLWANILTFLKSQK